MCEQPFGATVSRSLLAGWLEGFRCLDGWLASWLDGWLAGWVAGTPEAQCTESFPGRRVGRSDEPNVALTTDPSDSEVSEQGIPPIRRIYRLLLRFPICSCSVPSFVSDSPRPLPRGHLAPTNFRFQVFSFMFSFPYCPFEI